MGAAERRRGADAERAVVNYLRAAGWNDARRYLAGDGRQPGDIDWHPCFVVEVKDVAASAWPTWCRQALAAADLLAGEDVVPMVVRRVRGVPDVGQWEARIHAERWWEYAGPDESICVPVDDDLWLVSDFGRIVSMVRNGDAYRASHPAPGSTRGAA